MSDKAAKYLMYGLISIAVSLVFCVILKQEDENMTDQIQTEEMDAAFGEHMDAELSGDLDRTMATMSANPHLVNVPTMVGGQGPDGVDNPPAFVPG